MNTARGRGRGRGRGGRQSRPRPRPRATRRIGRGRGDELAGQRQRGRDRWQTQRQRQRTLFDDVELGMSGIYGDEMYSESELSDLSETIDNQNAISNSIGLESEDNGNGNGNGTFSIELGFPSSDLDSVEATNHSIELSDLDSVEATNYSIELRFDSDSDSVELEDDVIPEENANANSNSNANDRELERRAAEVLHRCPSISIAQVEHLEDVCYICHDLLIEHHQQLQLLVKQLPCRHLFHANCISKWLLESLTCPTCRHPLTP